MRQEDRIELAGLQLRPQVQGRGIGRAIVRDLQREASDRGVPLDLGVEHYNPRARALYERLGFTPVGETDEEHRLRWTPDGRPPAAVDA